MRKLKLRSSYYSNWYLSATRCPSSTLISWENRVMRGGSQRNSSSGMDQKYRPERCWGEAHVSRSSSLFNLLSHSNSQLQWRGFPPKESAKEEPVRTPDVAKTWKYETKTQKVKPRVMYLFQISHLILLIIQVITKRCENSSWLHKSARPETLNLFQIVDE